jgi:hypothetical protein
LAFINNRASLKRRCADVKRTAGGLIRKQFTACSNQTPAASASRSGHFP